MYEYPNTALHPSNSSAITDYMTSSLSVNLMFSTLKKMHKCINCPLAMTYLIGRQVTKMQCFMNRHGLD